jgi:hypothetical protein
MRSSSAERRAHPNHNQKSGIRYLKAGYEEVVTCGNQDGRWQKPVSATRALAVNDNGQDDA